MVAMQSGAAFPDRQAGRRAEAVKVKAKAKAGGSWVAVARLQHTVASGRAAREVRGRCIVGAVPPSLPSSPLFFPATVRRRDRDGWARSDRGLSARVGE